MVSEERRAEFDAVRQRVVSWAEDDADVSAVLLVGSWARDAATMESDVDVVVVAESRRYVESLDWIESLCGADAELVRTEDWGALTERRVRLASGFEIEFGFVALSWAATDPVDPGTRRVVSDGCSIWFDPEGTLGRLVEAVGATG